MLRAQSLPGVKYVEPNRQVGAFLLTLMMPSMVISGTYR